MAGHGKRESKQGEAAEQERSGDARAVFRLHLSDKIEQRVSACLCLSTTPAAWPRTLPFITWYHAPKSQGSGWAPGWLMPKTIDAEKAIRALRILPSSDFRISESVWVDPTGPQSGQMWYSWKDSSADADPNSWVEEYCRVSIPLSWVEPLLLRASEEGRSEGVVPANCWSKVVYVYNDSKAGRTGKTYNDSKAGRTGKTSPSFDQRSWLQDLVLVRLTLTPTTLAIEIQRT